MPRKVSSSNNSNTMLLESRLAEVKQQVVGLQEEVSASTASEAELLQEVLSAQTEIQAANAAQQDAIAEMRSALHTSEESEMKFKQDASWANADVARLQAEVAMLR